MRRGFERVIVGMCAVVAASGCVPPLRERSSDGAKTSGPVSRPEPEPRAELSAQPTPPRTDPAPSSSSSAAAAPSPRPLSMADVPRRSPTESPALTDACPEDMARIPGGAFVMGTHGGTGEYAYISRPAHRVELDSFCLDKREVTVEAYQRCVDAGTCTEPAEACVGGQPRPLDHPVNCVDWHQSRAYCLGRGKDLPTEAQWEYAGRGGAKQHDYPWGNGSGKGRACFMNVSITTCAVGTFPEEAFGLFDMAGNVSEWTFDWLSEGYPKTVPRNYQGPPAPPIPSSPKRTFRGGSFEGQFMQSASPKARGFALPGTFGLALGFRCAS